MHWIKTKTSIPHFPLPSPQKNRTMQSTKPTIFFDLETTGVSTAADRIR
ncbi:MAG: hypothetical protein ACI87N_001494 [Flavobacteriales bacterium]